MTQRQLFGTDGIRGQANIYPITVELMLALGRALGRGGKTVVIGKDTRLSGYALEQAIAAGVCSMGGDVRLTGPLPTPAIAYLTKTQKADYGVVISASHNPFQDNGVKIFGPDGFKLSDAEELELERQILRPDFENPLYDKIGKAKRITDAAKRYISHLRELIPTDFSLKRMRIVLDCANGAAYKVGPELFLGLGADLFTLGERPNGLNINQGVGSLEPKSAQDLVELIKADVGIVLDGDADRVVMIDEKGDVVSGDALLALIASYLKTQNRLGNDTLVCTDMSNLALENCLAPQGIRVERAAVGDRYVMERLRSGNHTFGGEESGHLILLTHSTTGDGLAGALLTLAIMKAEGKPLSELKNIFKPLPRAIENRLVPAKIPFEQLPQTSALMREIESSLGESGRLFVRYSGTERKLRILIEGPDATRIKEMASKLAETALAEIKTSI